MAASDGRGESTRLVGALSCVEAREKVVVRCYVGMFEV